LVLDIVSCNIERMLMPKKAIVPANTPWNWSEKSEAVTCYMLTGNMRVVAETTGIPYDTLTDWRKTDWWQQLVEELRTAKKAHTGNKLSAIVNNSLELLTDRLENGDWVLNNKTGQMTRRPVSLRDATQLTNSLMTRQLQMEELADRMEHRRETVQDTLKILAKEFQKWNRIQNKGATEVAFKETENAVHDQWEERLQEGSGKVYQQAGSEEEEGGAECSTTDNGASGQGT
jgi:hypothetical protein